MLALSFNSCVKDDYDQPPVLDIAVGEVKTVTDIQALAAAHSNTDPLKIAEDMSMYGLITMGEKSGNLYKQAIIEDETGGILLGFLGSTSLSVGDSIMVNLNGARVYNYNGLPQVDSLDITKNVLKLSAGNTVTLPELTLAEINTGAYTGRVAKINGVQFVNSDLGKVFAVETVNTNRNIEDCDGNSVIVRTSGYANFADKIVPEGNGSMVAFVSIFSTPQLLIRTYDEIDMNGERCNGNGGGGEPVDPVDAVNEAFDGVEDYTDVAIDGWTNILVSGDRLWQGKTFNTDKYVQASGYNSGLSEMETWLITPPVTNISTKVLSFKSGIAYWTHTAGNKPMTVLISTDFVGDNFETATWTELNVNLADENSSNYAWTESGEVDLSNFSGNAAIAFKYVGSDSESTSALIDDVVIDVSNGGGGGGGTVDPVDEINEEFNSAENYTDVAIEGWTNINVQGDRKWQGKVFDTDKYIQATGYNSGLDAMEIWLITPPVTNISEKVLSFKSGMAYWSHTDGNNPLTVLISTDFVGDNFETANWEELTVTLAGPNDANYAWVESGEVDLSAYSGNAAIAFKYVGSDTESTSSLIDDVVVTNGNGGGGGGGTVDMINEDFSSQTNYENIAIEGWVNVSVAGDRMWQGKTYNDETYAQATGYNSGLDAMETWLITPKITDIGSKSLSLKTAMAYWAHGSDSPMTVYVSEDYDGENYATATWVEISVPMANEASGDHNWVESGEVSLSNFDGDAAIAFVYVGSDTESTSYRLDDIVVQ